MLLIEQVENTTYAQGCFVKCPVCKTGRLFDKAKGVEVVTIPPYSKMFQRTTAQLYIKCPKCARRVGISFTN